MTPLLFLFVFQSALAFAFTLFIVRVVTGGEPNPVVTRVRNISLPFAILIPAAASLVFLKSLPEGEPAIKALFPALWIFMIFSALVLALTIGNRKWKSRKLGDGIRHPRQQSLRNLSDD